jgi:iron complex transport system substrate-binding protein
LLVFSLLALWAIPCSAVSVKDEIGRTVETPSKPERIVALTPSLVEVLFALDLGDKVVGATEWSDYPAQAKNIIRVGSYVSPSLEKIVALSPDLVLANREGNPPWLVEKLAQAKVPVYVTNPRDPVSLPQAMEKLGRVCGASEKGRELARALRLDFAKVREKVKGLEQVPTLLVVGSRPLITAGPGSYGAKLLAMAGGKSIAPKDSGVWPRLGMEYVVQARPRVVIISTMERGQNLERELLYWQNVPGLADMPGYRVEYVDSDLIDRPGPRLGKGLIKLADLVHPGLFSKKGETK